MIYKQGSNLVKHETILKITTVIFFEIKWQYKDFIIASELIVWLNLNAKLKISIQGWCFAENIHNYIRVQLY